MYQAVLVSVGTEIHPTIESGKGRIGRENELRCARSMTILPHAPQSLFPTRVCTAASFIAPHPWPTPAPASPPLLCRHRSGFSVAATTYSALIARPRDGGGRSPQTREAKTRARVKRNTVAAWKRDMVAVDRKRNMAAARKRNSRVPVHSFHSLHAKLHFLPFHLCSPRGTAPGTELVPRGTKLYQLLDRTRTNGQDFGIDHWTVKMLFKITTL